MTQNFSIGLFLLKVRDGQKLEAFEIRAFIQNLPQIPDAQISAFLVHAFHQPLCEENMVELTLAMRDSGDCLHWDGFDKPVVDKHSTGGVGDKITICLAPLVAALGLAIPTVAGRGLGHTGGTTDKFEAVPGFSCDLSSTQMIKQVRELGVAVGKQSDSIAPADRKLYALRDVTGTVPSIPLITASILSKKLAESLQALVIDLKWGNGAFMTTIDDATALAESLIRTANGAGTKTRAIITNMNQPLGLVSGNLCEMMEAVAVLKNQQTEPLLQETRNLTLELAVQLYLSVYPQVNKEQALQKATTQLNSGKAYEIFCQLLARQGADGDYFEKNFKMIPACQKQMVIKAASSGFVRQIQTQALGQALVLAKAGRQTAADSVDASVSLHHPKKQGDAVQAGDVLCTLHYNDAAHAGEMQKILQDAYEISEQPTQVFPLIQEVVE